MELMCFILDFNQPNTINGYVRVKFLFSGFIEKFVNRRTLYINWSIYSLSLNRNELRSLKFLFLFHVVVVEFSSLQCVTPSFCSSFNL